MSVKGILKQFQEIAYNPQGQKDTYLKAGKKVILVAPVYTPEEIIHAMDMVPMGVWGGDLELKEAKAYFPSFICSIVQSIVELGMRGSYQGASGIIIPSLCDSLKVIGENWKYAVPNIPFIPMVYPQNRKPEYGIAFTKSSYERVIRDLETHTEMIFSDEKLEQSIQIYNEHNKVMREVAQIIAKHSNITAVERNAVFKSATFMLKEEHTILVKELIKALKDETEELKTEDKIKIITSGILADNINLLNILDECGFQIVADDVAAESRQYRIDTGKSDNALTALAEKFALMDNCSVLYDAKKKRVNMIVDSVKELGARGLVIVLTKFCDPEEFDYPLIKKACEAENIPIILIEVDRQMVNYEQARTMIETFREML